LSRYVPQPSFFPRHPIWSVLALWVEAGQQYRIEITLTDPGSSRHATESYGALVPKEESALLASSVILAKNVVQVPPNSNALTPFIIDDMKVAPNLQAEYVNGQFLIPYLQIYHASIDPATGKPSLRVSFVIKSGDKVLNTVEDPNGRSVQSASAERAVIVSSVPLRDLRPERYELEVRVTDKISNLTVIAGAFFDVRNSLNAPFERLVQYFNVKR
jgi:hypothetical protein